MEMQIQQSQGTHVGTWSTDERASSGREHLQVRPANRIPPAYDPWCGDRGVRGTLRFLGFVGFVGMDAGSWDLKELSYLVRIHASVLLLELFALFVISGCLRS